MIAGLILAAGDGSRFGGGKLTADLAGRPVLSYAAEAMLGVQAVERVLVVLGDHADSVAAALPQGGFETIVCPDFERGISASLRAGVAELGADPAVETIVLTLGDQPLITPEAIVAVLESMTAGVNAARAVFEGEPGHPVIFGRELFASMLSLEGDSGAQALLERAGVRRVEASQLCRPDDVDTREDLEMINSRLSAGTRTEEPR